MSLRLLLAGLLVSGCASRSVELFGDAGPAAPMDAADLSDRDPERCGAAGRDCEDFEYCVAGECVCRQGLTRVVERCVDTLADGMHCGGPNQPCGGVCDDGTCAASCPAGTLSCLGGCADVSRDPLHCGECERKCGSSEVCVDGECEVFRPAPCAACPCTACGVRACCGYPSRPADIICVDEGICPAD